MIATFDEFNFNFRIQILNKKDFQPVDYKVDPFRKYLKFGFTQVGVFDDDTINYQKMKLLQGNMVQCKPSNF